MPFPTLVYYFPLDGHMEEGSPIEISLVEREGRLEADLSKLPLDLQQTLSRQGVPDLMHTGKLFPKDGSLFLDALVRNSSAYRRFRSSADHV